MSTIESSVVFTFSLSKMTHLFTLPNPLHSECSCFVTHWGKMSTLSFSPPGQRIVPICTHSPCFPSSQQMEGPAPGKCPPSFTCDMESIVSLCSSWIPSLSYTISCAFSIRSLLGAYKHPLVQSLASRSPQLYWEKKISLFSLASNYNLTFSSIMNGGNKPQSSPQL